jgi:hypothetical protein
MRQRAGRPEAPAPGTIAEANIGPSGEITALAVGYGHLVPDDTVTVERRVETSRGELTCEFPVAGLTSWLCLKADALMRRDKLKDAYDIVWILAALGPEEAARIVAESQLLAGSSASVVVKQLDRLVGDQFADTASAGPGSYTAFLNADPGERERRFAMETVKEFGRHLVSAGVGLTTK